MKKRFLYLTTLVVAFAAIIGTFSAKDSAKADSTKNTAKEISYKISIPYTYSTGKNISEMVLHYGVNGWQDIKDATMYVTTGDYNYGVPSSYTYNAIIKVNKGDTINYCLKSISKDGISSWNNNNGKDFSVVAYESNVKTIEYEIDWLAEQNDIYVDSNSEVTLRYGINGWDNPIDIKMDLKGAYQYEDEKATYNLCLKNEKSLLLTSFLRISSCNF